MGQVPRSDSSSMKKKTGRKKKKNVFSIWWIWRDNWVVATFSPIGNSIESIFRISWNSRSTFTCLSLSARAKPIEVLIKCLCIRCFPSTCRIRLVLLMSLHLSLSLCLVGFISSDGERVALIEIPPRQMFQLEIDDEDLDSFFLGAFSSIDADLLSSRLVRWLHWRSSSTKWKWAEGLAFVVVG